MDKAEILLADELSRRTAGTETVTAGINRKRVEDFIRQRDSDHTKENVEALLKSCEKAAIQILTRENPSYPDHFRSLPEMPLLLFAKGNLRINRFQRSLGIIGARRCTPSGKDLSISLARKAVEQGICVISGMAKGIDSYAQTAGLKNNGYTIAVLANGLDICYPPEHAALMDRLAADGTVISEYPPGTRPFKYRFPMRNRLIAALSDQLFIIDAGRHSGTGTTVEYCRKYGKQVLSI
jgi:DNA processing protein